MPKARPSEPQLRVGRVNQLPILGMARRFAGQGPCRRLEVGGCTRCGNLSPPGVPTKGWAGLALCKGQCINTQISTTFHSSPSKPCRHLGLHSKGLGALSCVEALQEAGENTRSFLCLENPSLVYQLQPHLQGYFGVVEDAAKICYPPHVWARISPLGLHLSLCILGD